MAADWLALVLPVACDANMNKPSRITVAAPFGEILSRMRRSARNGERLHLDAAHVVAIMTSPIYAELAKMEAEEIASQWKNKSDLANFGLLGEPTERNGRYAGMTAQPEPAAESQLVSAITMEAIRQSRRSKPLPLTSPDSGRLKKSTSTHQQASVG